MAKYVSVADSYTIYELKDDAYEMLSGGMLVQPPQVVLEVLVMNGVAKKVGTVSTFNSVETEESEDGSPPEGEGPWVE